MHASIARVIYFAVPRVKGSAAWFHWRFLRLNRPNKHHFRYGQEKKIVLPEKNLRIVPEKLSFQPEKNLRIVPENLYFQPEKQIKGGGETQKWARKVPKKRDKVGEKINFYLGKK